MLRVAHVANAMAQAEGDFEKGDDGGAAQVLDMLAVIARTWHATAPARGGGA